jgi:hypothetical protein
VLIQVAQIAERIAHFEIRARFIWVALKQLPCERLIIFPMTLRRCAVALGPCCLPHPIFALCMGENSVGIFGLALEQCFGRAMRLAKFGQRSVKIARFAIVLTHGVQDARAPLQTVGRQIAE